MRFGEPLNNHCTFRVGGPADAFYELNKIDELPALIAAAQEKGIAYRLIGRGTNVLFTDKGFRGLIIKNFASGVKIEDNRITAESGTLLMQLVKLAVENNLTGLEPLYGLPGTLGAAIWGNAGVPGCEIGMFVRSVSLFNPLNPTEGARKAPVEKIEFSYRHTSLQDSAEIVMSATLELKKGAREKSKEEMKIIDAIRRGKQPIGYSAGSFFKNPSPDKPAGMLIDRAGLKGKRIGGAMISEKHANFFMNAENATAAEILKLADLAAGLVKEKFGIELEMEVKVIG